VRLVEDFPSAVKAVNSQTGEHSGLGNEPVSPIVAILPNPPSAAMHVSEEESVVIQRPMTVVGLSLPPPGPHIPILRLARLEICSSGVVELRNFVIVGIGAKAAKPRGIFDSAIVVARGVCKVIGSEICMAEGRAGFGIVVGCGPTPGCVGLHESPSTHHTCPEKAPHATLLQTQVQRCSIGCLAYLGGQLTVGPGSSIAECGLGVSVCDVESTAIIDPAAHVACADGMCFQQLGGGSVRIEHSKVPILR